MMVSTGPIQEEEEPENPIRLKIYRFIRLPKFDVAIAVVVVLNAILLAAEYWPSSKGYDEVTDALSLAFTIIYVLEAILKLYALGLKAYFKDHWNKFDFVITAFGLVNTILQKTLLSGAETPSGTGVLRLFRIARVFRIVKTYRGLRTLLQTLYLSIPDFINVSGVVFLIFFVYAIAGTRLFYSAPFGDGITDYANFRNFGNAMLTLFRMSTGENWQAIMADTCRPKCNPCTEYDWLTCPNGLDHEAQPCDDLHANPQLNEYYGYAASLYFVSFVVIASFVFVNLFIAVIVENFENSNEDFEGAATTEAIVQFVMAWKDHNEEGKLMASKLGEFCFALGRPMGLEDGDDLDLTADDIEAIEGFGGVIPRDIQPKIARQDLVKLLDLVKNAPCDYPLNFDKVLIGLLENIMAGPVPDLVRRRITKACTPLLAKFEEGGLFGLNVPLLGKV